MSKVVCATIHYYNHIRLLCTHKNYLYPGGRENYTYVYVCVLPLEIALK